VKDGIMWVPLRGVAEALGARVDWSESTRSGILYLDSHIVTLQVGYTTVSIDGGDSPLQDEPYLDDGEIWVPVRLFEKLGYHLQADVTSKSVSLSK
jgi:hypothetical protein